MIISTHTHSPLNMLLYSVCAGRFLALRTVMQFAAATVSAYDIVLCETDDGKRLRPETTTFHEETIR